MIVPFSQNSLPKNTLKYIESVVISGHRHGDGPFTEKCSRLLSNDFLGARVYLTQSCSAALEMAVSLAKVGYGDEVIMPSFNFVSSGNAVVARGATPVFVDVQSGTQNICPSEIEAAITRKTRAIIIVHYAGVSCDMKKIKQLADDYNLFLIEDAAQAIGSKCFDKPIGTFGQVSTLSFHDSKNISSGEGGALVINDKSLTHIAEVVWEKGTNRKSFMRGEVSKYKWVALGSSHLPSEVTAAFLLSSLEQRNSITKKRRWICNNYERLLREKLPLLRLMEIPSFAYHNGHIFYVMLPDIADRQEFIRLLHEHGVTALFHYSPLHSSPFGSKNSRSVGSMRNTHFASEKLVRLPVYPGMTKKQIQYVTDTVAKVFPLCCLH